MATIDRLDGLRIVVYSNDHRPAHVHVIGSGCEAVFDLNCPEGPVVLRENYGFSRMQITRIRKALATNLNILCTRWREIHGE